MISKFTRHLGPKCRGDHSPRIRFPILVACCTSPRMEILFVPRLVVFGCSYPFTQDIGPGLSFYAIGAQGKIGPHNYYLRGFSCLGYSFFFVKKCPYTPLFLSRDKTKRQSCKNTIPTPTKILPKK